jgi:hypothetical protein
LWCLGQFYKDVISLEDHGQGPVRMINFVVSVLVIKILRLYALLCRLFDRCSLRHNPFNIILVQANKQKYGIGYKESKQAKKLGELPLEIPNEKKETTIFRETCITRSSIKTSSTNQEYKRH